MNPALILTFFFFVATAWADSERIFYTRVRGRFKVIDYSHFIDLDDPYFLEPRYSTFPLFTLKSNGVAYTGNGTNKKYFSSVNGSFFLGSWKQIKPYELKLNSHFKVLNLYVKECLPLSSSSGQKLVYKERFPRLYNCSLSEVYLKPPIGRPSPWNDIENRAEVEEEDFLDKSELRFLVEKRHLPPAETTGRANLKTSTDTPSVESTAIDTLEIDSYLPPMDLQGNPLLI